MSDRICRVCEQVFTPRASGTPQVYCSTDCRDRRRQNRDNSLCVSCGGPIPDNRRRKAARTCSKECRAARKIVTHTAWRNRVRPPRICAVCEAPARRRSPYCSDACRDSRKRVYAKYVRRYVSPLRTRPEHCLIMEQILGRKLRPFETVHHRNGIRADNRSENLEVWTQPQPVGQRPEDLVAWVVEFYPDLVRAALDLGTQTS